MQIRENVLAHAFVLNSQEDIIYILRFSKGQWKLKENINNKNKKDQMKTLMSYQHNSIDFNLISLDSTQLNLTPKTLSFLWTKTQLSIDVINTFASSFSFLYMFIISFSLKLCEILKVKIDTRQFISLALGNFEQS